MNTEWDAVDSKRKLPKSRKAMEYRVYWLERKLKHLKVSEHRQTNRTQIAAMPDTPMKDLLHLTNEFHQANEQAEGLRAFTEELNKDTLTLNERSERLQELAAEKLTTVDRTNRQSRRIQERGRKINKESLKTAAVSRSINKASQDNIQEMQRRIDEAAYLSDLTRAQHEATDELNRKTRNLNEETVKTTANSLKINRHLSDTTEAAKDLNAKATELQGQLQQLKADLEKQGQDTLEQNQTTADRLEELGELERRCEAVAWEAGQYVQAGQEQIAVSQALNAEVIEAAEACQKATNDSIEQQQQLQMEADATRIDMKSLADQLESELDQHLDAAKSDLESFKTAQEQALDTRHKTHRSEIAAELGTEQESNRTAITTQLDESKGQIAELIATAEAATASQTEALDRALNEEISRFNQNARMRFIAVEERSKRLGDDFRDHSSDQLNQFKASASEAIDNAQGLVSTLSGEVEENLARSQLARETSEHLLSSAQTFQANTESLNQETRSLIAKSNVAINKVDSALDEVTNVSRKMFRETRELQGQAESLSALSDRNAADLKALNERSLEIQSDSIQTQSLSQEINRHSLDLNEQTTLLQAEFQTVRDSNLQLVHELTALKQQLLDLNDRSELQLDLANQATAEGQQAKKDFLALTEKTENLNNQITKTLEQANQAVLNVETQTQASQALFVRSEALSNDLERLKAEVSYQIDAASQATEAAQASVLEVRAVEANLKQTTEQTERVNQTALDRIQSMEATQEETTELNSQTREVHTEMRQAVSEARQINDDFMRGLESLSRKTELSEENNQQLLAETRQLQEEMNSILDLKHGIDGFQRAVDAGQAQLDGLIAKVDQCQEQGANHEVLVGQYQQRMETYQEDVTRYRESIIQLEQRFRTIDEQFQAQEVRFEDSEHDLSDRIQEQRSNLEQIISELKQNLTLQQAELDRTKQELKEDSDLVIERITSELRLDFDHKIDAATRSTNAQLSQTDGEIRHINSEMQQLNRSLQEEISLLKNETAAVNEQHSSFQQEQQQYFSDQRTRAQQQEFEIDTLRQQLGNYQRLVETQLDNAPHEQLVQRVKQLENNLRQQQRALKLQEAENDKPKNDERVTELQSMVDGLSRSMSDIAATNKDLKLCLEETRLSNQTLQQTNRELETNLASSQTELDHCLQRVHRLENREVNIEEALNSIKNRDTDTQATLQQMRNAVKDSTQTMRETQKTLESLSAHREALETKIETKKRDWMSPKQAVMSSIFAMAVTWLGFFGYEEVNASYEQPTMTQIQAPAPARLTPREAFADLSVKLAQLQRANKSIVELGEFAWPVNFGIADPSHIEYKSQHQGISIEAELGDPVVAINDGTVLYSDNEIRGYGNMIVIQHDDDLLSVYANNQYNYVNEGDLVKRGQLIGDIGQLFNENTAGLYFEIRRDGKPTDPFNYLRTHAANNTSSFDLISAR